MYSVHGIKTQETRNTTDAVLPPRLLTPPQLRILKAGYNSLVINEQHQMSLREDQKDKLKNNFLFLKKLCRTLIFVKQASYDDSNKIFFILTEGVVIFYILDILSGTCARISLILQCSRVLYIGHASYETYIRLSRLVMIFWIAQKVCEKPPFVRRTNG